MWAFFVTGTERHRTASRTPPAASICCSKCFRSCLFSVVLGSSSCEGWRATEKRSFRFKKGDVIKDLLFDFFSRLEILVSFAISRLKQQMIQRWLVGGAKLTEDWSSLSDLAHSSSFVSRLTLTTPLRNTPTSIDQILDWMQSPFLQYTPGSRVRDSKTTTGISSQRWTFELLTEERQALDEPSKTDGWTEHVCGGRTRPAHLR